MIKSGKWIYFKDLKAWYHYSSKQCNGYVKHANTVWCWMAWIYINGGWKLKDQGTTPTLYLAKQKVLRRI